MGLVGLALRDAPDLLYQIALYMVTRKFFPIDCLKGIALFSIPGVGPCGAFSVWRSVHSTISMLPVFFLIKGTHQGAFGISEKQRI
ncbi:MAG: hypothetical protein HQL76_08385 [Magnetococcales bacterium]|nr:hypothetical protein [Magnetococcales bacterium]